MITIISGTDRKDGLTHVLAKHYFQMIQSKSTEEVLFYSLEDLPPDLYGSNMYNADTLATSFQDIENKFLIPAQKLIFIIPEYNGSFPGILKLFIDACSIRSKMAVFKNKKAALVGVATGRAGNIRGLEHFTSVMMFMGVVVMPQLLPISGFNKMVDMEKNIVDINLLNAIENQIEAFLKF
ncbi:MAG: NAD(P)H-dependent oxidoreductase [Saprospiraceae bacterium]|nr:NAD(P)H-dependent oxidoreductase [Saprospiraceae bacterium]